MLIEVSEIFQPAVPNICSFVKLIYKDDEKMAKKHTEKKRKKQQLQKNNGKLQENVKIAYSPTTFR